MDKAEWEHGTEEELISPDCAGSQMGEDESRREDTDNERINTLDITSDSDRDDDGDGHSLRSGHGTKRKGRIEARRIPEDENLERWYNRWLP